MRDFFWYLVTLPMRFYIMTWAFLMTWRGKKIPKWLEARARREVSYEGPSPKPEKYKR